MSISIPGAATSTLWDEVHAYDDLPRVLSPESGWLQNANDPPWTTTFPRAVDPQAFPAYMAPRTPVVAALCTTSAPLSTVNTVLVAIYTQSRLYGGLFSVLLFGVILLLIVRMSRKAKAGNEQSRQASQQEKQQLEMLEQYAESLRVR